MWSVDISLLRSVSRFVPGEAQAMPRARLWRFLAVQAYSIVARQRRQRLAIHQGISTSAHFLLLRRGRGEPTFSKLSSSHITWHHFPDEDLEAHGMPFCT